MSETVTARLHACPWNPNQKDWRVEGRRGNWNVQIHGDIISYHQIKYGTVASLAYAPQSRLYWGRVVSQTDDTIVFTKATMKELGIKWQK